MVFDGASWVFFAFEDASWVFLKAEDASWAFFAVEEDCEERVCFEERLDCFGLFDGLLSSS